MHFAIFGNRDVAGLAPRWADETVFVLFGGALLDLTRDPPADNASLKLRILLGVVKIVVPAGGIRLSVHGKNLDGGQVVTGQNGEGPRLRLHVRSLFGRVELIESPSDAVPQAVIGDEVVLPETGIVPPDAGVQPA